MTTIRERIEDNFYEKFDDGGESLPLERGTIIITINENIIRLDLSNENDMKFIINLLYNSELYRLDFGTNAWDEILGRCYEAEDWYSQTLKPVEIWNKDYDVLAVLYSVDIDRYTEAVRYYMRVLALNKLVEILEHTETKIVNLHIAEDEIVNATFLYCENYIKE